MKIPHLLLIVPLLAQLGCKTSDTAERERELAERERDLARKELEQLKKQTETAQQAPAQTPVAPTPERPVAPAAVPKTPTARTVTVTVSVTVAPKKTDGNPWDALGNAPDPLITVVSGTQTLSAGPFQDQFAATAALVAFTLTPGDAVAVKVVDKDVQQNDFIGAFSTEFHGSGTAKGTLGGGTVSVTFQ